MCLLLCRLTAAAGAATGAGDTDGELVDAGGSAYGHCRPLGETEKVVEKKTHRAGIMGDVRATP